MHYNSMQCKKQDYHMFYKRTTLCVGRIREDRIVILRVKEGRLSLEFHQNTLKKCWGFGKVSKAANDLCMCLKSKFEKIVVPTSKYFVLLINRNVGFAYMFMCSFPY